MSNTGLLDEEAVSPLPLSSTLEGDSKVISGYAVKFNQKSKKLGNFYEVIAPHALDGVDLSDVKCLVDHQFSKILGRTKAGTLKLSIDSIGLKFSVEIPNTTYANDLYASIKRGDVDECSFGFKVDESNKLAQTVTRQPDGNYLRIVKRIESLAEISIVANPAYNATSANIERDYEQAVRDYETTKLNLELELLSI